MMQLLPQWMKMAKDDESVGAKFLDAFGLQIQDIEDYLDTVSDNMYIGTADISQVDVIYKVPLAMNEIANLVNLSNIEVEKSEERHPVFMMNTLEDFYEKEPFENFAMVDKKEGILYLNISDFFKDDNIFQPIDAIIIDGLKHTEYHLHHIWNAFDEFGLLLNTERLIGERNPSYKERLLDVFKNPGNSTKEGLINALSRELGVEKSSVSINELNDEVFKKTLLDENGVPTKTFERYVQEINASMGFTWDNMSWGEGYWRSIKENNMGFHYLPHIWDVSTDEWKDEDFQSGVGDGRDLLVHKPEEESSVRNVTYKVGLKGIRENKQEVHPEIKFKYKIKATGQIFSEDFTPEEYRYTVTASEIIYLHYIVRATKRYVHKTVIDFKSTSGFKFDNNLDPGLEIVSGNKIMSEKDTPYLKVKAALSTRDKARTSKLKDLSVVYLDTNDVSHTYTLTTQNDFTRNDSEINTSMSDTFVSPEGNVELGFGDFYYMIDTVGSFRAGSSTNIDYKQEGTISLTLPKV